MRMIAQSEQENVWTAFYTQMRSTHPALVKQRRSAPRTISGLKTPFAHADLTQRLLGQNRRGAKRRENVELKAEHHLKLRHPRLHT
jgi:hypothetical protein